MSDFRKMMTSAFDQAHGHCVNWAKKQSDEDILTLARYMESLTSDKDLCDMNKLVGYFALLGLMATVIEVEK